MTVIVGIKAAEGIVLAADGYQRNGDQIYDTSRTLFTLKKQPHGAVAFFDLLSLRCPRCIPASTLMARFDAALPDAAADGEVPTLVLATTLRNFLENVGDGVGMERDTAKMSAVVGGVDRTGTYGNLYRLTIPQSATPELVVPDHREEFFVEAWQRDQFTEIVRERYKFPFDEMPIEDCAELAEFLIQGTIKIDRLSSWQESVGGVAEVVTMTPGEGARWYRQKPHWVGSGARQAPKRVKRIRRPGST